MGGTRLRVQAGGGQQLSVRVYGGGGHRPQAVDVGGGESKGDGGHTGGQVRHTGEGWGVVGVVDGGGSRGK